MGIRISDHDIPGACSRSAQVKGAGDPGSAGYHYTAAINIRLAAPGQLDSRSVNESGSCQVRDIDYPCIQTATGRNAGDRGSGSWHGYIYGTSGKIPCFLCAAIVGFGISNRYR